MRFADRIRAEIVLHGLDIIAHSRATLAPETVAELYPTIDEGLLAASVYFLTRGPVEIGVVTGRDAIQTLMELAGSDPDPSKCGPKTIRFKYGVHEPSLFGASLYFRNGFHRAVSSGEVGRDLRTFERCSPRLAFVA